MNLKEIKIGKTTRVITAFIFSGVILASCNVKPAADFTLDKSTYNPGEVVRCRNTSTDAATYKWTFHDGQTSASKDVDYTIHQATAPGTYSVTLEAFSAKGNKTSTATKSFSVN